MCEIIYVFTSSVGFGSSAKKSTQVKIWGWIRPCFRQAKIFTDIVSRIWKRKNYRLLFGPNFCLGLIKDKITPAVCAICASRVDLTGGARPFSRGGLHFGVSMRTQLVLCQFGSGNRLPLPKPLWHISHKKCSYAFLSLLSWAQVEPA